VARCLIVGCGCRGLELTATLRAAGHAVRGTTRDQARCAEIEAAGAEPFVGDPNLVGTLAPALAHVGVACILLGSATGTDEHLAALHGTRLDMLLERMLDTTVRGVVYQAAGSVQPALLRAGAERVRYACERSLIPYELLAADPATHDGWVDQAVQAIERALLGRDQYAR
jgi:nucleoside-diphosphate-sugar epimerase